MGGERGGEDRRCDISSSGGSRAKHTETHACEREKVKWQQETVIQQLHQVERDRDIDRSNTESTNESLCDMTWNLPVPKWAAGRSVRYCSRVLKTSIALSSLPVKENKREGRGEEEMRKEKDDAVANQTKASRG